MLVHRHLKLRWGVALVPLLLAPLVLLHHGEAAAAPASSALNVVRYERLKFSEPPRWTISGTWGDAGQLILADPVKKAVLQYLVPSGQVQALPKAVAADLDHTAPARIQATRSGDLVVELANDRLVTFGRSFQLKARRDVVTSYNQKSASRGARVESLWGWTLAGSDLLGYGDLSFDGRQRWESGIFRLSMANPPDVDILFSTPLAQATPESETPDSSRLFYRLGLPFLTATEDGTGYVLVMKNPLGIYRLEAGKPDLDFVAPLPKGLEVSPDLPDFKRKEDLPSVMRAIEQSTMPAGLWGWEGHLYLLSRAPAGARTRWTLTKIDPRPGAVRVLGSVVLPTQANHLTVVPGTKWWAFVEKGPVLGFGNQVIDSAVLVPSQALRGNLHVRFVTE